MKNYDPVIKKENLEHGAYYEGKCRNATVARWNAERELFYHWRTKFGNEFIEDIKCPEDDKTFDVFIAEKKVDANTVREIPFPKNRHYGLNDF